MSQKIIKKSKEAEVLVAYTMPEVWRAVERTNITVQGSGSADAEYIAFIRLGLKENDGRGVITHIAKVKRIESNVSTDEYLKKVPELVELHEEKGWKGFVKEYYLEEIKKCPIQYLTKKVIAQGVKLIFTPH
jgi:hypothetical protein